MYQLTRILKLNNNIRHPIGATATGLPSFFRNSTPLFLMFLQTAIARDEVDCSLLETLAEVTLESIAPGYGSPHRIESNGESCALASSFPYEKYERLIDASEFMCLKMPAPISSSPLVFSQRDKNPNIPWAWPIQEKVPANYYYRRPLPLRTILPKSVSKIISSSPHLISPELSPLASPAAVLPKVVSPNASHSSQDYIKETRSSSVALVCSKSALQTLTPPLISPERYSSCVQPSHILPSSLSEGVVASPNRLLVDLPPTIYSNKTSKSLTPSSSKLLMLSPPNTKMVVKGLSPLIPATKLNTLNRNTGLKRGRLDVLPYYAGELFDPNSNVTVKSVSSRSSIKSVTRKNKSHLKDLFERLRESLALPGSHKYKKWDLLSKAINKIENLKEKKKKIVRSIKAFSKNLFKSKNTSKTKGPSGRPSSESHTTSMPKKSFSSSKCPTNPNDCAEKQKRQPQPHTADTSEHISFSFEHFI